MTVTAHSFGQAQAALANKEINWTGDSIKCVLCTNLFAPNMDTQKYKSDITNELSTVSTTLSASASAGATTISVAASIPVGNMIVINGVDARVVTAVSGSGPYTLTVAALTNAASSGATVAANPGYTAGGIALSALTSTYNATGHTQTLGAANTVWAAITAVARYAVVYDSTPASDATRPLVLYQDFGTDVTATGGAFTVAWNASGILTMAAA